MKQNDLYHAILNNLFEGVYIVDRERRIQYWNGSAENLTGFEAKKIQGRACYDNILMHVDREGTCLCTTSCPLAQTMQDGQIREAEIFLHHEQGHRVPVSVRVMPVYDDKGEIVGAVEFFQDNTERVVSLEKIHQLQHQTLLDPLTGLGNRAYAETRLENAVREAVQLGVPVGVLFADIDRFKSINDRYGHAVGDRVLRMAGQSLLKNIKTLDFAGRWGGEEFLILLNASEPEQTEATANRLRIMVEQSQLTEGDERIRTSVSIGATQILPEDTCESVYQRADRLMYLSKAGGRNRVTVG